MQQNSRSRQGKWLRKYKTTQKNKPWKRWNNRQEHQGHGRHKGLNRTETHDKTEQANWQRERGRQGLKYTGVTNRWTTQKMGGKTQKWGEVKSKIKQEVAEPQTQTMTLLVIIGTHVQPLMQMHMPKRLKCSWAGVQRRKELVHKKDAMFVVHFGFNQHDTGQKQSSI